MSRMPRAPRVLVVDDDYTIAITLSQILRNSGFDAVAAFSGPDALKLAHGSVFDILLTDVVMSPMDGVQLAIAFRNINPASHVFLLSGTYEEARQMLIAANDAWDFHMFWKPTNPVQIIEALLSVTNPISSLSEDTPRVRSVLQE